MRKQEGFFEIVEKSGHFSTPEISKEKYYLKNSKIT